MKALEASVGTPLLDPQRPRDAADPGGRGPGAARGRHPRRAHRGRGGGRRDRRAARRPGPAGLLPQRQLHPRPDRPRRPARRPPRHPGLPGGGRAAALGRDAARGRLRHRARLPLRGRGGRRRSGTTWSYGPCSRTGSSASCREGHRLARARVRRHRGTRRGAVDRRLPALPGAAGRGVRERGLHAPHRLRDRRLSGGGRPGGRGPRASPSCRSSPSSPYAPRGRAR